MPLPVVLVTCVLLGLLSPRPWSIPYKLVFAGGLGMIGWNMVALQHNQWFVWQAISVPWEPYKAAAVSDFCCTLYISLH